MLETNYYAMTGLVSAFVCATILVCNNLTFERGDTKRRYFSALLVLFTITTCFDTVWGFMSTKTLNLGHVLVHISDVVFRFQRAGPVQSAPVHTACSCSGTSVYPDIREYDISDR